MVAGFICCLFSVLMLSGQYLFYLDQCVLLVSLCISCLNPFIISDPGVITGPSCHGYPGPFLRVLFLLKTSGVQAKHLQSWIFSKVCDFPQLGSMRWHGML